MTAHALRYLSFLLIFTVAYLIRSLLSFVHVSTTFVIFVAYPWPVYDLDTAYTIGTFLFNADLTRAGLRYVGTLG